MLGVLFVECICCLASTMNLDVNQNVRSNENITSKSLAANNKNTQNQKKSLQNDPTNKNPHKPYRSGKFKISMSTHSTSNNKGDDSKLSDITDSERSSASSLYDLSSNFGVDDVDGSEDIAALNINELRSKLDNLEIKREAILKAISEKDFELQEKIMLELEFSSNSNDGPARSDKNVSILKARLLALDRQIAKVNAQLDKRNKNDYGGLIIFASIMSVISLICLFFK